MFFYHLYSVDFEECCLSHFKDVLLPIIDGVLP